MILITGTYTQVPVITLLYIDVNTYSRYSHIHFVQLRPNISYIYILSYIDEPTLPKNETSCLWAIQRQLSVRICPFGHGSTVSKSSRAVFSQPMETLRSKANGKNDLPYLGSIKCSPHK